jgi:catechol 2,3-dioxygenase-like lactoylglutathione lyase family enzyme
MLKDSKLIATISTADIAASRKFYSETLGLPSVFSMDDIEGYLLPDGSALTVYVRPNHVPPENTAVTFLVGDIDAEMADLRNRGVTFEEYDMPGLKTQNGVASFSDDTKTSWFKDPAGNILSLGTMPPGMEMPG